MKRKAFVWLLVAALLCSLAACSGKKAAQIPYWRADSPTTASIVAYVGEITNEKSAAFVPPERRISPPPRRDLRGVG